MKKKLLSMILSLALVLCMIPATAVESFAGGYEGNTLTLDDSMMSYTMHIDENYNFLNEPEEKQWYYHPSTLVLNPSQAGYYQLEFTYYYTELDDRKVTPSFEGILTQDYFHDITKLSDKNVLENKVLKKRTVPFYIDTQANGPLRMNMSYWEEGYVSAFFKFKVDLVPVAESDLTIKDISLDLASCFVNNYAYTPEEMLSDDGIYYQLPNKNDYTLADLRDNILFYFSYNYYNGSSVVFDHTKRNSDVEITKYLGGNYFNISDDGLLATRELDFGYHIEAQILDGNGNPMDMSENNRNLQLGNENFYSICLKMFDRNGSVVFEKTYRFRTSGVQKFEITGIGNVQAASWSEEMTKVEDNQFEYDCTRYDHNPTVDELFDLFTLDYSTHGSWGEDQNGQFSYLKALTDDEEFNVSAVVTDTSGKIHTAEDGYLPKGEYTISIYSDGVLMTTFTVNLIHDEYDLKAYITDAKVSVPNDANWEYESGVYKYEYGQSDTCSSIVPIDIKWHFVFELKDSENGDTYKEFDSYEYYWIADGNTLYYYNNDRYVNKAEIRIKDGTGNWVCMEDESCLPFGKYELTASVDGKNAATLKLELYKEVSSPSDEPEDDPWEPEDDPFENPDDDPADNPSEEGTGEHTHSGGAATCASRAVCEVCGEEYGEPKPHSFDAEWKSNGYHHWHECKVCGAVKDKSIHATTRIAGKKATAAENGYIEEKCEICGEITKTSIIYAAKTIKLAKSAYVYDGKAKKPAVTVKNSKGTVLTKGTDYTLTYAKGRTSVGKYTVTVKGKGKYSFTKKLTFKINPKATTITKVTPKSKAFVVKWAKRTAQITGYELQYSTSSGFKTGNKKVLIKTCKTVSKTIKNLKAKKTYYVRVRTYKTVSGVKYYSAWSAKKSVKTK